MPYCMSCRIDHPEDLETCPDCGGKLLSDEAAVLVKDFQHRVAQSSELTGTDSIEVACLKCGKRAHVHPLMISMPCPACGGDFWLADKPSSADSPVSPMPAGEDTLPVSRPPGSDLPDLPMWAYLLLAIPLLLVRIFKGTWKAAIVVGIIASVLIWTGVAALRWLADALIIGWVAGGISLWLLVAVAAIAKRRSPP
jgi:hypothetical protein